MVSYEKQEKLYETLLEYGVLTKKDILASGLSEIDIENFLNLNLIASLEDGIYEPKDPSSLSLYARCLFGRRTSQEKRKAIKLYRLANKIDPAFPMANFALFQESVRTSSYEEAYHHLKQLRNYEEVLPKFEYNFCLYLLNFIIELCPEDRCTVNRMTLEEISAPTNDEKRDSYAASINSIRTTVWKGDLGRARMKSDRASKKLTYAVVPGYTIKRLIAAAQSHQNWESYHPKQIHRMAVPLNYFLWILNAKRIEYAFKLLDIYLEDNALTTYKAFIETIVLLSVHKKELDCEYLVPMLESLRTRSFIFDEDKCMTTFEESMMNRDPKSAILCLHLLKQAHLLGFASTSPQEIQTYLKSIMNVFPSLKEDIEKTLLHKPHKID